MREKLARFLEGRNGLDSFSKFLTYGGIALMLLGMILTAFGARIAGSILWYLAFALIIYGYFRIFSKKVYKRQAENRKYHEIKNRFVSFLKFETKKFNDRKEYRYFTCPKCRAHMRVPVGKGNVEITCRKCGTRFSGKT